MARGGTSGKRMKPGYHAHDGHSKPHPIEQEHTTKTAIAGHKAQVASDKRADNRKDVRRQWKAEDAAGKKTLLGSKDVGGLTPAGELKRPSTMDERAHGHFKKIYAGLIAAHQEKHGIKDKSKVREGFHTIAMPEAWRKFKLTHEKGDDGMWQKKK